METDLKLDILSKNNMESEVWYDHQYGCYKVEINIWPKYYGKDQRTKSIVIVLRDENLYWTTSGMVVPHIFLPPKHKD
jgi:hypothetical protein